MISIVTRDFFFGLLGFANGFVCCLCWQFHSGQNPPCLRALGRSFCSDALFVGHHKTDPAVKDSRGQLPYHGTLSC